MSTELAVVTTQKDAWMPAASDGIPVYTWNQLDTSKLVNDEQWTGLMASLKYWVGRALALDAIYSFATDVFFVLTVFASQSTTPRGIGIAYAVVRDSHHDHHGLDCGIRSASIRYQLFQRKRPHDT